MRRGWGVACACTLALVMASTAQGAVVRPFAVHAGESEQLAATNDGGAALLYFPEIGGTGYCKLSRGHRGCTARRSFFDSSAKLAVGPGHDVYIVTEGDDRTQVFKSSDDGRTFAFLERLTDNGRPMKVYDLAFSPSGALYAMSVDDANGPIVAQLPLAQDQQTLAAAIDTPYVDAFDLAFAGATPVVTSWRDMSPSEFSPAGYNALTGTDPSDPAAWSPLHKLADSDGAPGLVSGTRGLRMYLFGPRVLESRWTGTGFTPGVPVARRHLCCFASSTDAVGDYDHLWAGEELIEFQREGATAKRWVPATKLTGTLDFDAGADLATEADGRHAWLAGRDFSGQIMAAEFAVPRRPRPGSPPPTAVIPRGRDLGDDVLPATCVPRNGRLRVRRAPNAASRRWRVRSVTYSLTNGRRVTTTRPPFGAALPVAGLGADQHQALTVIARGTRGRQHRTDASYPNFWICGSEIRS